uniref:Uncharacterized protein n=1 Tax=Rhizophora mucronata TaxID=61149 RepID=A0A2P2JJD5_RHIMU
MSSRFSSNVDLTEFCVVVPVFCRSFNVRGLASGSALLMANKWFKYTVSSPATSLITSLL